jgi:hypothetical protein
VDLAKQQNQRAQHLCNQAFWPGLPEPPDASANLLREFRQTILEDPDNAPTGEAQMSISALEAPSNYLAFRMEMEALEHDLQLKVDVQQIPKPDPRKPLDEVKYILWKYKGTDGYPGLAPPGKDVSRAIGELASAPYEEQANWAAASRVADKLGPDRVEEILATMVHPPRLPKGTPALVWLPRVQLAAAQVAAQVDDGWEDSVRREALLSVLLGPSDWATEAAIRALAYIGWENEPYAPDIHDAFQILADNLPNTGFCCWEQTLFRCWLDLPHLYPQEREKLQEVLQEIEARGGEQEEEEG